MSLEQELYQGTLNPCRRLHLHNLCISGPRIQPINRNHGTILAQEARANNWKAPIDSRFGYIQCGLLYDLVKDFQAGTPTFRKPSVYRSLTKIPTIKGTEDSEVGCVLSSPASHQDQAP